MIINLTQHPASAEQVKNGVVEPEKKEVVKDILTIPVSNGVDPVDIKNSG